MTDLDDESARIAAGPQNKHDARRWVRQHWAELIDNADMGAVADLENDCIDAVWSDECVRISRRILGLRVRDILSQDKSNG